MEISHSSHHHRLIEHPFSGRCSACQSFIRNSSPTYGCKECRFYLHESCARLKENFQHSDHPQHPLFLTHNPYRSGSFTCNGCSRDCKGFSYHCSECGYDLDLECALQNLDSTPTIAFQHKGHQLAFSNLPIVGDWRCLICNEILDLSVFKCKDHGCQYRIHFHCAPLTLPETTLHWRHKLHPLVFCNRFLEDDSNEYYCESCEQRRNPDHPVYYCKQCPDPYIAHTTCALSNEVLKTLAEVYDSSVKDSAAVHHEHPLILRLVDSAELLTKQCTVCNSSLQNWSWILTCQQCDFYLHESCRELAMEIQRPCHTEHSLTFLADATEEGSLFRCNACKERYSRYIYQSSDCGFNLCLRCDSLLHPTKFEYLNHKLFLFKSNVAGAKWDHCGGISSSPSFICVEPACTYNLHSHCVPFNFPETIEHKGHKHPLSLTNCSSETHCFICRDKAQRGYPLYCCEECGEYSHVGCALHEVLPKLFADYENSTSEEKITKLDAELENLRIKKREMKAHLIEMEAQLSEISKGVKAVKVARSRLVEPYDASKDNQKP